MKNKYFLIFVLLHFTGFLFAYDFGLKSIETENNSVTVYRGKSMQTVSDDNYLISMLATKNDHGIQFSTSITNYSSEDYMFREDCITVYQGIYENDDWNQIKYVPASLYFENEKKAAKTEEVWSAIALGLSAASAGYSTVTGTGYSNGYRYTYKANVYSSADAAIATANSYMALDNLQKNNQNYLENLENNLLFDSFISSNGNYNGFFVVDEEKGPDYKVVFEMTPNEEFVFYFTRSDKDEILNPWKDKSHDRHSVIAGISPTLHHFSAYYLWSRPKGVGFYGGITYQKDSTNIDVLAETFLDCDFLGLDLGYPDPLGYGYTSFYDWKFDYDSSNLNYDSIGMFAGLTIKTLPNTWLLAGMGIEMINGRYYEGDIYYRYRGDYKHSATDYYYKSGWIKDENFDILFSPQIGINFITNHLDIGCMATIPIKGKFSIDITLGYAF